MKQLTFEGTAFSFDYTIKDENNTVGTITDEGLFSKKVDSSFENEKLTFEEVGFWDRKVNIYQGVDNQIGTIQLSNWSYTKASIKFDNQEVLKLEKDGWFSNDWKIVSENNQEILARISNTLFSNKGKIDIISNSFSNNSIATSLFLNRNYTKKVSILIMFIAVTLIIRH